MSLLDDLVRKRKGHLTNCVKYLQTKLQHECHPDIYQLVQDRISLINDHFRRIDDISALIEMMPPSVREAALVSSFRASFYDQIFSRLREIEGIVGVLDDVWSNYVAFENFSKKFTDQYSIFSKLCDEVSIPLGSHFSMFLPGSSFGYFRFPNVSRLLFRVFVPISAIENPYVWPIMAHEIGHAFSFLPTVEELIGAECGPLISQRLSSIRERVQRSREEFAEIEYVLSRSWYQWVAEMFADLFALRRMGPCFIDSEMFELMAFDPFSLSLERIDHLSISSHPPPDFRIKSLIRHSNQWFSHMSNHASTCQKIWDEMSTKRSSPTLEEQRELFDLFCDRQMIEPIEQKIVTVLDQLVPLQNIGASSFETLMNTHPIHVTSALSSLFCEGMAHANFVEELAKRVRLAT